MNKIPDGWKKTKLHDVADVQTGIAKNQHIIGEKEAVPYLRVANVQDGYIDLTELKTISVLNEKVARFLLQPGDVLMTEGGDFDKLGRGAVWLGKVERCVHQNHVFAVRPHQDVLDSFFLSAQTSSLYGKRYFLSCSKQSTNLASINTSQLKNFPILLPPLPEQKAIADILSTWDEAIDKTERLIQAKEKRFKGLLHLLLREKKGWKKVNLGDVASIYDGTHSTPKYVEYGIPFYSVEHLTRGDFSNTKYISEEVFEKENQRVKLERNDILMTRIGDIGTAICLNWDVKASFYVSLALIKANAEKFDSKFMQYYINSNKFRHELHRRTIHVAFPKKINLSEINNCCVVLPCIKIQKSIASILTTEQEETYILKTLLEQYKKQKRGLMQKLLVGTWRVREEIITQYMEV